MILRLLRNIFLQEKPRLFGGGYNKPKYHCSLIGQVALSEAKNLGCEYAVSQLMAPGMAKGIAEKVGFKEYCILLPYLKTHTAS